MRRYLFLESVEVVDDDSDEEVEGEEGAADDEEDEVEVDVDVALQTRLLVVPRDVRRRRHHLHPPLERRLQNKTKTSPHSLGIEHPRPAECELFTLKP